MRTKSPKRRSINPAKDEQQTNWSRIETRKAIRLKKMPASSRTQFLNRVNIDT